MCDVANNLEVHRDMLAKQGFGVKPLRRSARTGGWVSQAYALTSASSNQLVGPGQQRFWDHYSDKFGRPHIYSQTEVERLLNG